MFERPAHVRVAALLDALDHRALAGWGLAFGGGTRIALELGEFRESGDVDFLTSDADGFAALRIALKTGGRPTIFTASTQLSFPREPKKDSVRADLHKACSHFLGSEAHRNRCFEGLAIAPAFQPEILGAIARWAA